MSEECVITNATKVNCNPRDRDLVIDFAISRKRLRAQMRTEVQYTQIFVIYANFEIFVYHIIDIPPGPPSTKS